MAKKRKGLKVGQSKIAMRKIGGKRMRMRITKKSGGKYSVVKVASRRKRR